MLVWLLEYLKMISWCTRGYGGFSILNGKGFDWRGANIFDKI